MKAQAKEDLQRIADEFELGANTKNIAKEEYDENKDAINVVYTLIHKHIKTASHENEHNN